MTGARYASVDTKHQGESAKPFVLFLLPFLSEYPVLEITKEGWGLLEKECGNEAKSSLI